MLQPALPEQTLSVAEVARRLQTSESVVCHWVATGILPCAHRLDSQGRVIECVIIETDFLAFAQQCAARHAVPLERMGTPPLALSPYAMTGAMTAALMEPVPRPHPQTTYVPASWRSVATGLRLAWVGSGLLILVAAALLAGWLQH